MNSNVFGTNERFEPLWNKYVDIINGACRKEQVNKKGTSEADKVPTPLA